MNGRDGMVWNGMGKDSRERVYVKSTGDGGGGSSSVLMSIRRGGYCQSLTPSIAPSRSHTYTRPHGVCVHAVRTCTHTLAKQQCRPISFGLFILIFSQFHASCSPADLPPPKPSLSLSLSHTERKGAAFWICSS